MGGNLYCTSHAFQTIQIVTAKPGTTGLAVFFKESSSFWLKRMGEN